MLCPCASDEWGSCSLASLAPLRELMGMGTWDLALSGAPRPEGRWPGPVPAGQASPGLTGIGGAPGVARQVICGYALD
jgi:hypothetical protein